MLQFLLILMVYYQVQSQTKLQLQGPQPLYMECKNDLKYDNGFVGNQYFYKYLTQEGSLQSLDKISFSLWMMVHSKMKMTGRQIIFSFVDGFTENAYLNLMLYYKKELSDYYLYLVNNKVTPEILRLKIIQENDLFKDTWNHIFLSIDQNSTNNTFINLKFFSTHYYQLFQITDTLVYQKLVFKLGQHTRITNERLKFNDALDYKACINVANFDYFNGWTSMDQEMYVDYDPILKFALKPYASNGIVVDQVFDQINLRQFTLPLDYTGNIGINLYKSSQIVYNFLEQFTSLTFMFWIKPQNIKSSFQFLSLTDDILQETSIGFGVGKNYDLLFYQIYSKIPAGALSANTWKQVTAGFLDIGYNANFEPLNQKKAMRILIDNVQTKLDIVTNIKPYKRLIIGPVFMDDYGLEIIEIQDIKIFKGNGIKQVFNQDCQLFVGQYCAFCKQGTHYCKEQDPNDDSKVYNCPAGYKESNNECIKIIIQNCLRVSSSTCEVCAEGYQLTNGLCQSTVNVSSPYYCKDSNAQYCQVVNQISKPVQNRNDISKLCLNNLYSNSMNTCSGNQVANCQISQFQSSCALCQPGFALPQNKICAKDCSIDFRFQKADGYCVNKCEKYLFSIICVNLRSQGLYSCNPSNICSGSEKDIGYYCLKSEQSEIGKSKICQIVKKRVIENVPITCNKNCKYCYGTSETNCLGCYDNMYYNPHTTSCQADCRSTSAKARFKLNNKYSWVCELECPSWLYTQGSECVKECSQGYKLYKNQCFTTNLIETYQTTLEIQNNEITKIIDILIDCPEFCESCTNDKICTKCLNVYPMDQGMCVESCYPKYLDILLESYSCKENCGAGDLIYSNENINGYSLNQCFKQKCGIIKVNKEYQTFLHQTDLHLCVFPCEGGYYGHPILLQCQPCHFKCKTCDQYPIFCTSCFPMTFLQDSDCFDSCKGKFQNYMNWKCEGSCSSGFKVIDKALNINACVEKCGEIFATYLYSWNNGCYEIKPEIGAYCEGYECFNCNFKCKTCSGPNSNQCLTCKPKSYLQNNECVKYCIQQLQDDIHWLCVDECPKDSFKTSGYISINGSSIYVTSCAITCLFDQYQFKENCYNSQQNETYCLKRDNYYYCDNCASVCKVCETAYSTSCTVCSQGAYLQGTTCYTDCPNATPYKDDSIQKCVASCPYYAENGRCVYSCSPSYYQYFEKKLCYQMGCPIGTYNQLYTKYCYNCYSGCATCTGGDYNNCLSCLPGYFLNGGTLCLQGCTIKPKLIQDWVNEACVQNCPLGTYLQTLPGGALACKKDCPIYYYSNLCVSSCPEQTYLDQQICKSCASPCSECFGSKINQCTKCDFGYYIEQTTCYAICPDYKPYANLADQRCVVQCPEYLYLKKNFCFSPCPTFLYYYELHDKKECVDQCYSKSYLWLGKCYECDSICKECYGPNNGNCLECELPYFLNEQTCGNTCPQFYDLTDHICKDACPVHLVIQDVNCQNECDSGYLIYNQICIQLCPTFTFQIDNYCYDCNLFCSTCFGSTAHQCYSCINNYFLDGQSCKSECPLFYNREINECMSECTDDLYEITEKKECVSSCPLNYIICESKCVLGLEDGYYLEDDECQKCDPKCTKCTSATVCQACVQNFYLEVQSCVNFCVNQYLFMDPISSQCVTKCPPTLYHQESFGKRFCVEDCNFKLYDQCLSACPKGMYSLNKVCTKCPQNCEECESDTKCTKCLFGYYFYQELCFQSCVTGKNDRKNIKCVEECDASLYEYVDECLENCPTDPVLYKNKKICSLGCPNNTYQDERECVDCHASCLTCIGPADKDCVTCQDGYYLDNQICSNTCSFLYDEVNKECVVTCPTSLFKDQDKCVEICSAYQYINNCVNACPPLTYASNSKCFDCPENCQECNSIGCTICFSGTFLYDGLCNNYCPYYYNEVNNQCTQLCPKDTFVYIDHCYSKCPVSTYQYKNQCLLACPSSTVMLNNVCISCSERCLICKNDYECLKCENPYYLFNGYCIVQCPLQLPFEDVANGQCVTACPPESYEKGYQCVKECNLIIHQKLCLKTCPTGYYGNDYCKPCRLECKACTSFEVCTECSENFFLEFNQCETQCTKIKDLKSKSCVDVCNNFLYKNVCYETCPQKTYEQGNECVLNCIDGYYGSTDYKCQKCPSQCVNCNNNLECTKCNIGYYLHNKQCLDQCPSQFFSNPILNECSTKCPQTTFIFYNSCLFECPSEYYNDMENYQCVKNCGSQQYLSKKNCLKCSIECDQCTGKGNNNCIKCAKGFQLNEDGLCIGNCKDGYYKQDNSCYQCLHKCQKCLNGTDCTKCRGSNRNAQDCSCPKGYYDDEFQDDCKKCPCDECTSSDNCLICKNNLQIPKCNCDRVLNDDWCITCKVAKVKIYYSDDLNQIIVYFGYLISVNLINPFQPSNCSQWFDNSEIFGQNAQCYLAWNRYSVHIILKPYASVTIGDQLTFKSSFYRDVDQGICDGIFIEQFIENKVKEPQIFIKPYILFDVPSFISTCKYTLIKQILLDGTGQKIQNVLSWTLKEMENDEYFLQMDEFLASQSNEITIPLGTLVPNVTYTITAKYVNFFQRVNFTTFTFTTLPIQAPYVYLSFEPLMAKVYVFDCHVSFQDMKNEFNIIIEIQGKNNETYLQTSYQINPIYNIPLNESLLPKETPLYFSASTGSSIIKEVFYLKSKEIYINFLQNNRFIGLDNQINARGYDRNIKDEVLSTRGIIYEWLCNNLHNLQPCKTDENQIMQFPSRRIVNIFADSQNTTFVFFVKASKGNRWTVKEQLIVITDFNIEEEFYINNNIPQNYINANDEATILIKKQQKYAFIIQQYKILESFKISSLSIKFRLAGLTTDYNNPIYIYLIPGNESIALKLNDPPKEGTLNIEPLIGESLDYFYYTLTNIQEGNLISFYYYFEKSILENDVNIQSTINGIPLITKSKETSGQFQLPNGIANNSISVLCEIQSFSGAKSYLKQDIKIVTKNYEFQQLYKSLKNKTNFEDLQSLHTMIALIQLEEQEVCLKQCSGVGICVNNKCQCPPGYYFADCSGNKDQQKQFYDFLNQVTSFLIKKPINNNGDMKLFSQSLLFLQQSNSSNTISLEDCQTILQSYIQNTNYRLEQINQHSINLQYQSTEDFNYSQIDIRSLINKNDLHVALKSTVFMWEKTIFTQGSNIYQLQNYLGNFINNIIELSIFALNPNEKIDFSIDTASITIYNSKTIPQFSNRILEEIQSYQQQTSYDVVQAIYIRNYYAFDGYFPYPSQIYPLYSFQIRQSNRKENIELNQPISYKFGIQNDTTNLVCLQRNYKTYEWSSSNCTISSVNSTYFCNCTTLSPTTICNDYDNIYQGTPEFKLVLPNIFYIFYFTQLVILGIFWSKAKVSENEKLIENTKFGRVFKIAKRSKTKIVGNKISHAEQEKDEKELIVKQEIDKTNQNSNKFHFNYFWKYHCLSQLIYKQLYYLSPFMRSLLILLRWNCALIVGEVLSLSQFEYQVSIWIVLASILILRFSESLIKKQIKYFFVMRQPIVGGIIKILIFLLLSSTFLFGLYLYFMINNQTKLIISYTGAILADILLIDIIIFSSNRFLGENKKRNIRKRVNELKQLKQIQKQNE